MAKAKGGKIRTGSKVRKSGAKSKSNNPKRKAKSSGEGEVIGERASSTPVQKQKKVKKRVERILAKKEPQLVEGPKNALIIRGQKTSQTIKDVLADFSLLLKPFNKNFNRKNDVLPFEDTNSLEFLCEKNDCSTFALGTHSKKRPDNLILGRIYDGHLLDMYEFGVSNLVRAKEYSGDKKKFGSKPLFVFQGDLWEQDAKYERIQNLLLDIFRGPRNDKIALTAIDHILSFTVDNDGKILMRSYATEFLHSGSKVPNLNLTPMGPHVDLTVRRTQAASEDLWKTACKQPNLSVEKKIKNVTRNSLGDKVGTIHMKKQNLDKLQSKVRRVTALRDGKRALVDVDESFGTSARKK